MSPSARVTMSAAQRRWCPAVTAWFCCSGVRVGSALQGLVQGQGQGAKHFTGGPGEESAFKLTQIVGRMNFSVAVEMRSDCQGGTTICGWGAPTFRITSPVPGPTGIFGSMTAGQILLGHCISPTSPPVSGWRKPSAFKRLLEVRDDGACKSLRTVPGV